MTLSLFKKTDALDVYNTMSYNRTTENAGVEMNDFPHICICKRSNIRRPTEKFNMLQDRHIKSIKSIDSGAYILLQLC